ncbi:unnamed protein product [Trichogramma brassicae]|uniref:Adenosine deaminase n=1 Tax=Trichogramma brassicae TaxID=86971 RepID=A0A6H5IT49_9HYME|nr:unnamed protein product [Trichogramma brassicae]
MSVRNFKRLCTYSLLIFVACIILLLLFNNYPVVVSSPESYLKERERLIDAERKLRFGHDVDLTSDEMKANECLMRAKTAEIHNAFRHPEDFLPAQNFLLAREKIKLSRVFEILRKMPKGGLFHAHGLSILSIDKVLEYTRLPNLYVCVSGHSLLFRFSRSRPASDDRCRAWASMEEQRRKNPNLDEELKRKLRLNPATTTSRDVGHADRVWKYFSSLFHAIGGIANYKLVYEKFMYEALQELYDDNIMFLELRNALVPLYDLEGTTYTREDTARTLLKVVKRFCANNPSFLGVKLIVAYSKKASVEELKSKIEDYKRIKAAFPELIIGFDLVSQEDAHHSLLDYGNALESIKNETDFFFHAGETNWYGSRSDNNLYDAIALNSKRIGHGYALIKHPKLMEIVKKKKIVVEVSPISNQVLKLVADMRNHPAAHFFATSLPVVITSDDPSLWGASGLSYDIYEAFVGIMSSEADLRALKQLALNSIKYGSLNEQERTRAFEIFNREWIKFVVELTNNSLCADE